jgi:hypothetical protein
MNLQDAMAAVVPHTHVMTALVRPCEAHQRSLNRWNKVLSFLFSDWLIVTSW